MVHNFVTPSFVEGMAKQNVKMSYNNNTQLAKLHEKHQKPKQVVRWNLEVSSCKIYKLNTTKNKST
jgi:hypothetical protein